MHLFKNITLMIFLISTSFLMAACQSTSTTQTKRSHSSTQVTQQVIPVIKSKDGVQDIRWTLTQIGTHKALFFSQTPMLILQSNNNHVIGSTGCNILSGNYDINVAQQTIQFKTNAGYQRCDYALAQEANLMDSLARIEYFQVQNKTIRFMDRQRQVLIQAEQQ